MPITSKRLQTDVHTGQAIHRCTDGDLTPLDLTANVSRVVRKYLVINLLRVIDTRAIAGRAPSSKDSAPITMCSNGAKVAAAIFALQCVA
jgi:hypothetical protein